VGGSMLIKVLRKLMADESGATMVEYAIMVSLIAAICFAVVTSLGQSVSNEFSTVNTSF
jgi:Flp pilus assembly pilin Flp